METITFEDFKKLDIRIATIIKAEDIEGSEKLLRLEIDVGDETRQLLAGIKQHVEDIDSLVGKQTPVLVNLEPKQMMGLESQGMMLAASDEGKPILLTPQSPVPAGSKIT